MQGHYIPLRQTQWQSPCKPPHGQEQCHANEFTLGRLRDQVKWPTDALIRLHLKFCIFTKRLFYKKSHVLNQAIAALRQSVGLPGQFVTV